MSQSAFKRYAPFIREYIYRKKWQELREVQVEACNAIMDTDNHAIIASGTASGKTEAAIFPILSLLEKNPSSTIGVLYIGPLKALINDQFSRLTELLEEQNIPVWAWHGDISSYKKKKVIHEAKGVLQITPESLEAMLMTRPTVIKTLFADLRFIIIDEIHAFMGTDRGLQVLCLLARLERAAGCSPRRVGLSATLNDYVPAEQFISTGTNRKAMSVGLTVKSRKLSLGLESVSFPKDEIKAKKEMQNYMRFLYDQCHLKKCLVFANSRSDVEQFIYYMKKIANARKEPDVFYAHHGSIERYLREETERALKEEKGPTVAAATLTLELGIDIGDLDMTVQLGPPVSCSSFVQRLGRSGRRTGHSKMLFVESLNEQESDPLSALPWDLLQTIAVIQLYCEEHWVEPFEIKPKPFSLLVHQTLSILVQKGELKPSELGKEILTLPPFNGRITVLEYKHLLRFMIERDYLERLDSGRIIVGTAAENVCNHYSFYAVFRDNEEYRVLSNSGKIGTIGSPPRIGETFSLAGKAWKVTAIDDIKRKVFVVPSHGTGKAYWHGGYGSIHTKVVQRMKQILEENSQYSYLTRNSQNALMSARVLADNINLLNAQLFSLNNSLYICPWRGTKTIKTLERLLRYGLQEELRIEWVIAYNYYLEVHSTLSTEEFLARCHSLNLQSDYSSLVLRKEYLIVKNEEERLIPEEYPMVDKWDYMVPPELLRQAYLQNDLDIPEAISILTNLS